MYLISNISIDGFWDNHNFEFALDDHVNFFIGQNGTGKTTLINLVAAALTADFRTLDRMPFERITIALLPKIKGEKPSITVSKGRKKDRSFAFIDYRITPAGLNSKELKFSLDDVEEQILLRRYPRDEQYDFFRHLHGGLIPTLNALVSVNWLSIHRAAPAERGREERAFESSVDRKLESLSNELVRYFATLSKQKDEEIREFQEYIFLSLIEQQNNIDVFDGSRVSVAERYATSLETIFKELHVQRDTKALLSAFRKKAKEQIKYLNREEGAAAVTQDDLVFRIDLFRIAEVVKRWEKLQDRLKKVFSQRDKFQIIADALFQRKKLFITESNEIIFKSRSGKDLSPRMLSSGEKQLLILMSEALLQRESPAIFIADEPELSLHVLWQERLVASLHALNPNAQIVAATHSPDIVGALANKAIDMENLIQ